MHLDGLSICRLDFRVECARLLLCTGLIILGSIVDCAVVQALHPQAGAFFVPHMRMKCKMRCKTRTRAINGQGGMLLHRGVYPLDDTITLKVAILWN
jgi:hypothetical protein